MHNFINISQQLNYSEIKFANTETEIAAKPFRGKLCTIYKYSAD